MKQKPNKEEPTLEKLAKGFHGRTLVATKLATRAGIKMAMKSCFQ